MVTPLDIARRLAAENNIPLASPNGTRTAGTADGRGTEPVTPVPWEQPTPFNEHAGPPFPLEVLSGGIGRYVAALRDAYQVPADLPATLVLGTGAAAAAGRAVVRLAPDWIEPFNMFFAAVLPSGERKSPVARAVTRPLEERERELLASAEPDIARAEAERDVLDKSLQNAKAEAARVRGRDHEAAMNTVADLSRKLAEYSIPKRPRLLADDATPEAVASLLAEHQRIAIVSTEGGLFEMMGGRYTQGIPNLDVYLKGYSGDPLRVDRKGRKTEWVQRPALTVVLTVQPAVVHDLAAKTGFRGRGVPARFWFTVPQSVVGYRKIDGVPAVPGALAASWDSTLRALLWLPCAAEGEAERELRLSGGAHTAFQSFRVEVEVAMRPGADLYELRDWANKLPGGVARVAGILHLFLHADGGAPWDVPIAAETMTAAVAIGRYFTEHAKVAFAMMGADPALDDARHVLAWVLREKGTSFKKQDAWQGTRGRFGKVAPLDAALGILEERGFIRREAVDHEGPGRPAGGRWEVNPLAYNPYNPYKSGGEGNSRDTRDIRDIRQAVSAQSGVADDSDDGEV